MPYVKSEYAVITCVDGKTEVLPCDDRGEALTEARWRSRLFGGDDWAVPVSRSVSDWLEIE